MITYERSAFGLNLLFRVHGSATYRSILPALAGVLVLLAIRQIRTGDENGNDNDNDNSDTVEIDHPYAIGVVVSGITFLIVFRASQGYSRYWEATSSVYAMMSKWADATVHTASYHMQAERYKSIQPPSYNDYTYLDRDGLTRDRERVSNHTMSLNAKRDQNYPQRRRGNRGKEDMVSASNRDQQNKDSHRRLRSISKSINIVEDIFNQTETPRGEMMDIGIQNRNQTRNRSFDSSRSRQSTQTHFLTGKSRLDGNWGSLYTDDCTATFYDPSSSSVPHGFASREGGRTPPLFLQELAHLSSLLTAVALATLRNDVDGAESPLDYYQPGKSSSWPAVDPGDIPELYSSSWHRRWTTVLSFLGRGRTPIERTRYNAMRPLPVLGGVSNAEIRFLQMAKGPYAKTQLCWHWLSEFIVREHLAGSLGNVGAPIISRVVQFLGDGMTQYNHGRKIMSIPFPFVHAQLSAIFVIVMIGLIPFLMDQYCQDFWSAAMLTFLSILCLSGIHEVARELENPFRNVPNELPVVTLMAEYNESLIIMYSGFHPDAYWEPPSGSTDQSKHSVVADDDDATEEQRKEENSSFQLKEPSKDDVSQQKCTATISSHSQDTSQERQHAMVATEATTDEWKVPSNLSKMKTIDQLRTIVLEQGLAMKMMLEEQSRLNHLLVETLNTAKAENYEILT